MSSATVSRAMTDYEFFHGRRRASKTASTTPCGPISAALEHAVRQAKPPAKRKATGQPRPPIPKIIGPPEPSPPLSSPPPEPVQRKRKVMPPCDGEDPDCTAREAKRSRKTPSKPTGRPRKPKAPSIANSPSRGSVRSVASSATLVPPTPEPIYRTSRSRSSSSFPLFPNTPKFKREWRTEEDGTPGEGFLSSKMVVEKLMKTYKAYFRNPEDPNDKSFDPHPTDYPVVELEYPNRGAREQYMLLAPKDVDHYNPIYDLESSLYTIVEFYCTEEQQKLFGPIPQDTLSENISRSSTPDIKSRASSKAPSDTKPPSNDTQALPLLKAFKRALDDEDGPTFVKTLNQCNDLLRSFKNSGPENNLNTLMEAPLKWREDGLPNKVMMRIVEENYQRTVGPNVPKLRNYRAFSNTVYGELMPTLIDEIVQLTEVNENSLFLDLGSGVGNVCVQASLQTGCKSFGVELMDWPAKVAVDVQAQMMIRARMWGVRMGKAELEKGDMLKSKKLDELMPLADVVLVDNKVFTEKLNEALKPKFLDLKEGAVVVSLAPFVSSLNARVTERNVDDMSTIFDVTEREYGSGSVSWGNGKGTYYIHRVDREGYAKIREQLDASSKRRGTRRRQQTSESMSS